jgi:hypothetical protein
VDCLSNIDKESTPVLISWVKDQALPGKNRLTCSTSMDLPFTQSQSHRIETIFVKQMWEERGGGPANEIRKNPRAMHAYSLEFAAVGDDNRLRRTVIAVSR